MAQLSNTIINGKLKVNGTIEGSLSGNATSANSATTASKLSTSAGNASLPVYFSDGKPVQCSGTLSLTSADSNKLGGRAAADYKAAFSTVSASGATLTFTRINGTTEQATISVTVSGTSDSANAVKIENKSNSSTTGYLVGVSTAGETYQSLYATSKISFDTSTGVFVAPTFSGSLSGNATSASKLTTSSAGSASMPVYFSNGVPSAISSLDFPDSLRHGSVHVNKSGISITTSEASEDEKNCWIEYDNGSFKIGGFNLIQATTFSGAFSGNASTATSATNASKVNITNIGTSNTNYGILVQNASGNQSPIKSGITINPNTKLVNASGYTFSGAFSGNATTATALTSNAGSSTTPVYFSNGKPVACGHAFTSYLPLAGGTLTGTLNTKKIVVQGANASLNIENISASIDYAKIETPTDRALHLQAPSNTYLVVGDTTYSTDRTNKYKFIVNGISKFNPPANVANTAQSTIIIGTANGKQITIGKDKYGSSVITADIFNGTASGADHSDTSEVAYTVKSNELSNSDGNCKILVRDDKTDSNANVLETGITVNASTKVINLNGYTIPGLGGGSSSSSTSEVQYGHSKITSNFMLNLYVYYYIHSEQTGENYEVYLSSDQMGYCTKFKMISGVPHFQLGPCSNGVLISVEQDIVCEKVGTKMYRFFPTYENGMFQYAGFPVAPISTNSVYFVNVSTTPYTVNNSKSVVFYKESNIQPNVLPNQTLTYELFNTGLYVFNLKPSSATDEFSININFAPLKCEDKYLGRPIFFTDGDQNKFANYIFCDIDTVSNSSDSTTPVLTNILLIHQKGVMNFKSFAIEVTDTAAYVGFLNEV